MRRLPLIPALCLALFLAAPALAHDELAPPAPAAKSVDLVICLDTSGSMSGLIHAARQKLWSVVNEIATLKPEPRLRVALLTYGTPGQGKPGDVVLQTDLTRDLDLVSEKLFALGTNGGTELVGRVVHHALEDLAWASDAGLKTIFVAGNESADQDPEQPFLQVAARAKARDVFVNAIYCGGADDADAAGWRQLGAVHGSFSHIDHNQGTVNVASPFDKELAELSGKMNGTYVWYGREALERKERQDAQDRNADAAGAPAAAARAEAKAGLAYAPTADLVLRLKEAGFDPAKLTAAELPPEMRDLAPDARRTWLEARAKERATLQARIQELAAKRAAFVRRAMEEQGLDDSRSLDKALRETVRSQAKERGFEARSR